MILESTSVSEKPQEQIRDRCKLLTDTFFYSLGLLDAQVIYIEWLKRNQGIDCYPLIQQMLTEGQESFFSSAERNYIVEQYLHSPTTQHRYGQEQKSRIIDLFVAFLEEAARKNPTILSYETGKSDFDLNRLNGMSREDLDKLIQKTVVLAHQQKNN